MPSNLAANKASSPRARRNKTHAGSAGLSSGAGGRPWRPNRHSGVAELRRRRPDRTMLGTEGQRSGSAVPGSGQGVVAGNDQSHALRIVLKAGLQALTVSSLRIACARPIFHHQSPWEEHSSMSMVTAILGGAPRFSPCSIDAPASAFGKLDAKTGLIVPSRCSSPRRNSRLQRAARPSSRLSASEFTSPGAPPDVAAVVAGHFHTSAASERQID